MKKPFTIKAYEENGYVLFYLTHDDYKGRIRKHFGKGTVQEYENDLIKFRKAIEYFFEDIAVEKKEVQHFVDHYVAESKNKYSIFDYRDEFIDKKRITFNRKTESYLSSSSINSYISG